MADREEHSSSTYQGTDLDDFFFLPGQQESGQYNRPSPTKRKRDAADKGALDEEELSQREPGESSDEEPAEPCDKLDRKYMKMAMDESNKSPDEKVKVGALIVNKSDENPLGVGYNRMPKGCEAMSWSDNHENPLQSKYPFVLHGAKAAIKDAFENKKDIKGATIYTTLFPANTDAQWIAECGIKEVVYKDNLYKHTRFTKAAGMIFEASGVKTRKMASLE